MTDLFLKDDDPKKVISFIKTITEYHTDEILKILKNVFKEMIDDRGCVTTEFKQRRIMNPEKLTEKTEEIANKNKFLLKKYLSYFQDNNIKNNLELVDLYPMNQEKLEKILKAKTFREIPGAQERILREYKKFTEGHDLSYREDLPDRYMSLCKKEQTSAGYVDSADKYKEIWCIYELYNVIRYGTINRIGDNHIIIDNIFEEIYSIFSGDGLHTISGREEAIETIDVLFLNDDLAEREKYFSRLWDTFDTRKNKILLFTLNLGKHGKTHITKSQIIHQ